MKKALACIVVLTGLFSCTVTHLPYNQDISGIYRFEPYSMHPDLLLYHRSAQVTEVYYDLGSEELLYSKISADTVYSARVTISYLLTPSFESQIVLDSGRVNVTDIKTPSVKKRLRGKISVNIAEGTTCLLKISFYDQNRRQEFENYLDVFKGGSTNPQYFFVSEEDGIPLFRNTVSSTERVKIKYARAPKGKLYGRYFKRDFPAANPPFSILETQSFGYKPDSLFVLNLNDSGEVFFQAPRKGVFNFSSDSTQRSGLTLFRYYDGFPEIHRAEQMVGPLRYISSKEEFDDINANKNKKLAVENFWLNCAGNKDRGKEAIRTYYTRVRYANKYFSSYLEGWKTDRGMIYMIFGPPNLVYRGTGSETWIYGVENNINSISFNFNRLVNPLSDNDYYLQRSTVYKSNWFREVDEIWRQGRVYLQN